MIQPKTATANERSSSSRPEAGPSVRPTRVRYYVLGLSFIVGLIMFLDRACMGTASPMIMRDFGLDKITMGWSVATFNLTYSLFQIPGGWLADRFGSRIVLAVAIAWWSVFTAATGTAFNAVSLAVTRGLFGIGEAAAWPSASRALARWLPIHQRAFGQGFQHSGSRLGAAFAPTMVVFLIALSSWRAVFFLFGAAGILVAIAWYWYYRDFPQEHARVNKAELELLQSVARPHSKMRPAVPWGRILRSRDLLYLSLMYFCYGWVFWMYLQWLPTYLAEARHFAQFKMGIATSIPLAAATVTSMAGGWISDRLSAMGGLRRGRVVVSIAGFALAGVAILPGVLASDAAVSLACLTLAMAGLELTVGVSWAMCLDIAGDFSGSVTGVMNTVGNLGGAVSAVAIGYLATRFGWTVPFVISSTLCGVAAVLATRIDPTRPAVAEFESGVERP
jgi:sugar phosphate permease